MKSKCRIAIYNFIAIFVICILFGNYSLAEEAARIMEICTEETSLSIYVKNMPNNADVNVEIGTSVCGQVICQSIEDTEFETIILIDNSLSIPKKNRAQITELLNGIVDGKGTNEKIAIGVFSSDITLLADYTYDKEVLKEAIGNISYQDQETYITDMLYKLLKNDFSSKTKSVYRRIIVIGDGIDNDSIGYTSEELNRLIQECKYPVYAIGCETKNNMKPLENFFAMARLSGADYYLLDSDETIVSIQNELNADKYITKISVNPPVEMLDGSIHSVKVDLGYQSVSQEARMPQQARTEEVSDVIESSSPEETEVMEETEVIEGTETTQEQTQLEEDRTVQRKFIVGIIVFWIIVFILIIMVVTIRKSKKKILKEKNKVEYIKSQREKELKAILDNQQISAETGNVGYIILADTEHAEKSYKVALNRQIIIGRNSDKCQVIIDYDPWVSSRHCEIYAMGGKLLLRDLQSSNGTFMNGTRIFSDVELTQGCIIMVGHTKLQLTIL